MAKFSCEIKKLLVLGADPSFLYKKTCTGSLSTKPKFNFLLTG